LIADNDRWIRETAEAIATRHVIHPRTIRGWLSTGAVHENVADALATMADYGVRIDTLNAMVYTMWKGRPMGQLPDLTEGD
jgi:hypothetical protein